ncbi:MAG: hypothetical protein QF464_00920, partial [Myxococcota bacterium]|nr:hypothetical protein [Myxococcota bacterium]
GTILERPVTPEGFLVATSGSDLVGAVALTPQSGRVIELGSLVSNLSGVSLGRRLVEAAVDQASARGFEVVMALSAIPGFFERVNFRIASHAPWIAARRQLAMPHPLPLAPTTDATEAARAKASSCRRCPHLGTCSQALLLRVIPTRRQMQA